MPWPARALRSVAGLLGCVALMGACDGQDAADPGEAASEDAINFRPGVVDRTLPDVDAVGYEVAIAIDDTPGRETYRAEVKGTYVATRDLTELALDLDGNTVDGVYVGARAAAHRREGKKLIVSLPSPVADGKTFTTRIRYHGDVAQIDGADPNDLQAFGGLMVKQRNADGGRRIFTSLNWPSKGRRWIPLRDHPADGAMVAMTATFPKAFHVVANGKKVSESTHDDGTKTWRYEALTPMPVYDIHLVAYDGWTVRQARSSSGVPIASYTYARHASREEAVFGDVPAAMDYYEKSFGAYRWGASSFLEEPIFGGGMENASAVSMDETLFSSSAEAREVAFHELAHHWSGNLARIRTWNDFWLSEGMTEYLTARFIAAHDGEQAGKETLRGYLRSALEADRTSPHALRPVDPEIDVLRIFDAISYQKGALVLRQLERAVGVEKMTAFLRGWFARHAFQAVTTSELERELSEEAGLDLAPIFAGFIHGEGHPEVRVALAPAGGGEYDLTVEQVQPGGPAGGFAFPLDVDVLLDGGGVRERVVVDVTGRSSTKRVRLASPPRSLVVDPDEYLLGTVTCDSEPACKAGFSCGAGAGDARVCNPR